MTNSKHFENNASDRRRYMRFDAPLETEFKTLTLNPIFGKTLAKDLSREGMRLGFKQSVPAGTPIEICLNVPGDNLPVFATGRVAWADGLDAGIRLTRISQHDRARVLELLGTSAWQHGTSTMNLACFLSAN